MTFTDTTNLNNNAFRSGNKVRQGSNTAIIARISGSSAALLSIDGTISAGSPLTNTINYFGGSLSTMYGVIKLQESKVFDTKEEAQKFIDDRQSNLPYANKGVILPMEKMYADYDKFSKDSIKRAEDHVGMESSWMYEGAAAWTSLGGNMLNLATTIGDKIDEHVLKRSVTEKQPITTIETYYDKGTEKALEGIDITDKGITGITPSLLDPWNVEGNIVAKYVKGAAQQLSLIHI